jgi:pSer/pThr/pTyr-binding forkhead associated (FHA) protein
MRKENVDEKEKTRILVLEGDVAWIVVETGPDKGKEFSIDKSYVTIGRHIKNDICLPHDEIISRFHGRVSFDKDVGVYFYEDLNSTNGTTICSKWFKNEKVKIKHGDRILIGRGTQLRFFTKKAGLKDWLLG